VEKKYSVNGRTGKRAWIIVEGEEGIAWISQHDKLGRPKMKEWEIGKCRSR